MALLWEFDLYVTARTKDTRNNAHQVFTARALAHWSFNGSGTVGQTDPYDWTGGQEAKVTEPTAWNPVRDGSEAPLTRGTQTLFTHAIRNDYWSVVE